MATTAAVTDQVKQDWLNGVHQPGDTFMIALYTSAGATLNKSTTAYTASGEISGAGYAAGGKALSGFAVSLVGDTAELTFSNPSWSGSTITADTALIYNASRSNKALCVLTFGSASSISGTFSITMPASGAINIT